MDPNQIIQQLIDHPSDQTYWHQFLSLDSSLPAYRPFDHILPEILKNAIDDSEFDPRFRAWAVWWCWGYSNTYPSGRSKLAEVDWRVFLTDPQWEQDQWFGTSTKRAAVEVVNNLSQSEESRRKLKQNSIVDLLLPIVGDAKLGGTSSAIVALLYLCGSDEDISREIIEICVTYLNEFMELLATEDPLLHGKHSTVFNVSEVAGAVVCLSKSENNKKAFLPYLDTIFKLLNSEKAEYIDIQDELLQVLLQISFDHSISKELRNRKDLKPIMAQIMNSGKNLVASTLAKGLLFKLKEDSEDSCKKPNHLPKDHHGRHIMISYNWTHQPTLKRLVQRLKDEGYPLWFDLDQMGGSTLEAMAEAIESAELVLVGVSPEYKESANCRLEAEYAYNTKKIIVPLMMDTSWKPNGWLGALIGTKLWFDFSQDPKFETSYANLLKEIQTKHGLTPDKLTQHISKQQVQPSPKIPNPSSQIEKIRCDDWDCERVLKWLDEPDLQFVPQECRRLFLEQQVDGITLIQFNKWSSCSSPLFVEASRSLGIQTWGTISHFAVQLKKITNS